LTIHDQGPNIPICFRILNCSDGCRRYCLNWSETSPPWDLVSEQAVNVLDCQQGLWCDTNTIIEAFLS
jgi:hypothetical protein